MDELDALAKNRLSPARRVTDEGAARLSMKKRNVSSKRSKVDMVSARSKSSEFEDS
jgi:hypothetical protein